jgi:hypothetical protein
MRLATAIKLGILTTRPARRPKLKAPRLRLLWRRGKLRIYEVDGLAVRKLEIAFTMGGHDLVYPGLVPRNEVWIDNALGPLDQKYTTLHELHERRLMKTRGMGYDEAHESANAIESRYRKANGRGLDAALRKERGQ